MNVKTDEELGQMMRADTCAELKIRNRYERLKILGASEGSKIAQKVPK